MNTLSARHGSVVLALLGFCGTAGAAVVNPGFDAGLTGWTVDASPPGANGTPGPSAVGTVVVVSGRAVLSEQGSFVTHLEQSILVPRRMAELSFEVEALAGFDSDEGGIPDAFEARLVDGQGASVVPTWVDDSTAFFSLQQDGSVQLAAGVVFDGTRVTLDTSLVPENQVVRLVFTMVGADAGQTAEVAVDAVQVLVLNDPPVAVAGDDLDLECGDLVDLDGRESFDPDGDFLGYAWRDEEDELLDDDAVVRFDAEVGVTTYTLTVDDGRGGVSVDSTTVTVTDTEPPVFASPLADVTLDEGGTCAGAVPDFTGVGASDVCSDVTVTQSPAAGAALDLDVPVTVTVTATDAEGLSAAQDVVVTLTDADGSCNEPPIANAGPDQTVTCSDAPVVLDGTGSSDPEGAVLLYAWADAEGTPVANTALASVELDDGVFGYTLTVTDPGGLSASDSVAITVVDDAPPTFDAPVQDVEIDEAGSCSAVLPDLSAGATASDTCSTVSITQSPAAGTVLDVGEAVSVTLTATDGSGQTATEVALVSVIDPDESCNTAPVADAGPDITRTCAGPVDLDASASTDVDDDVLAFSWLDESDVEVGTGATVTVDVTDSKVFTVEVSDGRGGEDSDEVAVTVVDDPPVFDVTPDPVDLDEGGLCEGTVPDLVALAAASDDCSTAGITQSPAAGTLIAVGETVDVTLTATDDRGTSATATVPVTVTDADGSCDVGSAPVALWLDGTSGTVFHWQGSSSSINGLVHANGDVYLNGWQLGLLGGLEYAGTLTTQGHVTIDPAAVQVPVAQSPFDFEVADYAPGGSKANVAAYYDQTANCVDGQWSFWSAPPPGLHYADCDIVVGAWALNGIGTFVSTGNIIVNGNDLTFSPYTPDGLLFLAGGTGEDGIQVNTHNSTFEGFLAAPDGDLELPGSSNRFECGMTAQTAYFASWNLQLELEIDPAACPLSSFGLAAGAGDDIDLFEPEVPRDDGVVDTANPAGPQNDAPDPVVERDVPDAGGCSTTPAGSLGVAWVVAMLALARRRSPVWVALCAALLMSGAVQAREVGSIGVGGTFSGEVSAADPVLTWSLDVPMAGTRVLIDDLVDVNTQDVAFRLLDPYGRQLLATDTNNLDELGPWILAAGTHTVEVTARTGQTETFSGQVLLSPAIEIAATPQTELDVDLSVSGERIDYVFSVGSEGRYAVAWDGTGQGSLEFFTASGRRIGNSNLNDRDGLVLAAGSYTVRIEQRVDGNPIDGVLQLNGPAPTRSGTASLGTPITSTLTVDQELESWDVVIPDGAEVSALGVVGSAVDLRILTELGETVFDGNLRNLDQTFGPLVGGTYRFEVEAINAGTGAYSLDLREVEVLSRPVQLDFVDTIGFDTPGQRAEYTLTLPQASEIVVARYTAGAASNYEFALRTADGVVLQELTSFRTTAPIRLPAGDYVFIFDPADDVVAPLDFGVHPTREVLIPTTIGGSVSAGSTTPGETLVFPFTAPAETVLGIDVTGGSGARYRSQIIDADGRMVYDGGDRFRDASGIALLGGPYELFLTPDNEDPPTVTFTLLNEGPAVPLDTDATLPLGGVFTDLTVMAGDTENAVLSLASPARVVFEVETGFSNVRWSVSDLYGVPVLEQELTNGDGVLGPVDLPAGSWAVRLENSRSTAIFDRVRALELPAEVPSPLVFDTPVGGTVQGSSAWEFSVPSVTDLDFDLVAGDADLVWELVRVDGVIVDSGPASNPNSHDFGVHTLLPGDYIVRFVGLGQAFTFEVRTLEAVSSSLALGSDDTSALPVRGDSVTYTVPVAVATEAVLYVDGSSVQARLVDPAGRLRSEFSTNSRNSEPVWMEAGDWTLTLSATNDGADYRTAVIPAQLEPATYVLNSDLSVPFSIGAGISRFTFTLAEATRVVATASAERSTSWRLDDASGESLFNSSVSGADDVAVIELDAGTYLMEVDYLDAVPDAFTFSGRLSTAATREVAIPGRRWTDLGPVGPGERVVVDHVLTEGELVEWTFGVVGEGEADWRIEDPFGQLVRSSNGLRTGQLGIVGRYPEGSFRLVVDADFEGLSRGDLRIGRDEPGDLQAYYSRNEAADQFDSDRGSFYAVGYAIGPDGLELGVRREVSDREERLDGLALSTDGDLIGAGLFANNVLKVDPNTGVAQVVDLPTTPANSGLGSFSTAWHIGLVPDGRSAWVTSGYRPVFGETRPAGPPGPVYLLGLYPFGSPQQLELSGDDSGVTSLAFDSEGNAFYSARRTVGDGAIGTLDLQTGTTARAFSDQVASRTLVYDVFSDALIGFGNNRVLVVDPTTLAVEADFAVPNPDDGALGDIVFDQGEPLGDGRILFADNTGRVVYFDYRQQGALDATSSVEAVYLDHALDDVIPVSELTSRCYGAPTVVDVTPLSGTTVETGSTVVVSGRVSPVSPTRAIGSVTVGAVNAILDSDGRFFASTTVPAGSTEFDVIVSERCGAYTVGAVTIEGVDAGAASDGFVDVTSMIDASYTRTAWATDGRTLSATLVGTNASPHLLGGPLRLVLDERAASGVTLVDADGTTSDGRPFIIALPPGAQLPAGESAPELRVRLANPARAPIVNSLRWQGAGNLPPRFVSVPNVVAWDGATWEYASSAVDPNADPLTYSLTTGPSGASISATGLVSWTPSAADVGAQTIEVRVDDGLGGSAVQRFTLEVRPGTLNTPPVFTSAPVVGSPSGQSYAYQAFVIDPDGDIATFALLEAPVGASVDPDTGLVTLPGPADGQYPFRLEAVDGRGGAATQTWTLNVGDVPANPNAPLIVSSPNLSVGAGDLYVYQAVAQDADNDVLSWTRLSGPDDLSIDASSGRVQWLTERDQPGSYAVEIAVSDGTYAATQAFEVLVLDGPGNAAPVFTSSPFKSAVVGSAFVYDADAEDPEGYEVSFELLTGPSGAVIDPATGVVTWTPDEVPVGGAVTFGVAARDPQGQSGQQTFIVTVVPTSAPPSLDVGTPDTVVANEVWSHRVEGVDPEGFEVIYSLTDAPATMSIDARTGLLSWAATPADVGSRIVLVRVTDVHGLFTEAPLALDIELDTAAPELALRVVRGAFCAGQEAVFCVEASDDNSVEALELYQDGQLVPFTQDTCVSLTLPAGSATSFEAIAVDRSGNSTAITRDVAVDECDGPALPVVTITSPVEPARVAAPTDVYATIEPSPGADLVSWEAVLYRASQSPSEGRVIGSGTDAPTDGYIGLLDPTLLANDLWMVRVEATDSAGLFGFDADGFEVDGQMKLGSYDVAFEDAAWRSSIHDWMMTRSYTTLDRDVVGDFGYGWELTVSDIEITTNGPLGEGGWYQEGCGTGGFVFGPICTESRKPHVVAVRFPDGSVDVFDMSVTETSSFQSTFAAPVFTARPSTYSSLEVADPAFSTLQVGANGNLFQSFSQQIYAPSRYWLTTRDGNRMLLDVEEGLVETVDRAGNRVQYKDDGIFPDRGTGVRYVRDSFGRIERIELADGNAIVYTYDSAGDLVTVTDREGTVTQFVYDDEHRLVSYNDTGRSAVAVLQYDADGRLISQSDSSGVFVETSSDPVGWTETSIGPDPRRMTESRFDEDGMLVELTESELDLGAQPLARSAAATLEVRTWSFGYDEEYRLTSVRSPLGAITRIEYDEDGRMTALDDADGVRYDWTYTDFDDVLTASVDGDLVAEGIYDAQGNLLEERTGDGTVLITRTYTDWGGLETWTDADGHLGRVILDDQDRLVGYEVDGRETQFRLDDLDRVVGVTDPEGDLGTATLNARGEMIEFRDARGHVERWEYDDRGFLISETDKAARTSTYTYDDDGRILTHLTREGELIQYTYDVAGRVEEVAGPDTWIRYSYDWYDRLSSVQTPEQTVAVAYDLDGRVVQELNSGLVNESLFFTYTPDGRPVRLDSTYGWTEQSYDTRGRPVAMEDSRLGLTEWQWNNDDLLTRQERIGGLVTEATYTDGQRVSRLLTRDGATVVQDLLLERDPQGRITSKTDAVGDHTYTYDDRGRLLTAAHSPESGLDPESYTYDAVGNRLEWTGNPASEVNVDDADRLTQDERYHYRYDLEGRVSEREDRVTGEITDYTWDSFDRLVSVTDADGTATMFTYDGIGRRIELAHDGSVRRYLHDGGEILGALDGAGTLRSWVGSNGGDLTAEWADGSVQDAVIDHLGTRVGWYGATGLDTTARDTFGVAMPEIGASGMDLNAVTWHPADPTGLVYMRARYYDPRTGRFITEDPMEDGNAYPYAANNPVSVWDPFGTVAASQDATTRSSTGTGITAGVRKLGIKVACKFDKIGMGGQLVVGFTGSQLAGEVFEVTQDAACAIAGKGRPRKGGRRRGPGGCGGNSFTGDTLVATPEGQVRIDEVSVGDLVIAFDHESEGLSASERTLRVESPRLTDVVRVVGGDERALASASDGSRVVFGDRVFEVLRADSEVSARWTGEVARRVTGVSSRPVGGFWRAVFRRADGSEFAVSTTEEHPFYVPGHGGYIDIRDLEPGAEVQVGAGGLVVLLESRWLRASLQVFNFEVEEFKNYFASNELLVHNGRKPWSITNCPCRSHKRKRDWKFYNNSANEGRGAPGTWWSPDTAGHGGSAWKVFKEMSNGDLKWVRDADEFGNYIKGKHKGPTGMLIKACDLKKGG